MKVEQVNSGKSREEFIQVHVNLNRDLDNWIRPLDQDIHAIFSPEKNKKFKTGHASRWIARDDNGKLIGRIAAFYDPRYTNKGDKFRAGGIGFFDSVNDQQVADLLFDTARSWLLDYGVEAMDGPINFGERNNWWGLITEGFQPPVYGMNYNPPYYKELFENYGFQLFYNQFCWHLEVEQRARQLDDSYYAVHEKFMGLKGYSVKQFSKSQSQKFAEDFATVYNSAWAGHAGNKEVTPALILKMFRAIGPVLDPKITWFVYKDNIPIAIWMNIPDINPIIKGFHGKFGWIQKLLLMVKLKFSGTYRFVGIVFGIIPKFQGIGVDKYLIVEAEKTIKENTRYKELELQWQGDFNPKIINISKSLSAEKCRNLVTYRYIFDREIPFERHPVI